MSAASAGNYPILRVRLASITGLGRPEKINLDGNAASHRGLRLLREEDARWQSVRIRARRYLNKFVRQDHLAIKWRCASMLGLKSFRTVAVNTALLEHFRQLLQLLLGKTKAPPATTYLGDALEAALRNRLLPAHYRLARHCECPRYLRRLLAPRTRRRFISLSTCVSLIPASYLTIRNAVTASAAKSVTYSRNSQ